MTFMGMRVCVFVQVYSIYGLIHVPMSMNLYITCVLLIKYYKKSGIDPLLSESRKCYWSLGTVECFDSICVSEVFMAYYVYTPLVVFLAILKKVALIH